MQRSTMIFAGAFLLFLSTSSISRAITFCQKDSDHNCFTGKFGLVDIPGDKAHKRLEADFGYVDPTGNGWQTNKDAITDGASIPPLLQPFVGSAWEESYIRAAVIHDWYCDRHVRPWKITHRVFYDAMLASGLGDAKAKLMFYAVYAFGPHWGYTIPGTNCAGTKNCIQSVTSVFVTIPAQLNDVGSATELKAVEAMIELAEGKGGLSIDELAMIADRAHPKQSLSEVQQSSGAATK